MPAGWAAAAAAGGSIIGAGISAAGASSAARTEAGAANNATNLQKQMFTQTQGNLSPFMATGAGANTLLSELLGVTPQVNGGLQYQQMTDDQREQALQALRAKYGGNEQQAEAEFSARGAQGGQGFSDLVPSLAPPTQPLPQGMSLGGLMKPFTAADFHSSPGYQFQLGQGINAIDNSASAKGFTGNTLKDLMTFGQGLANQDWWNAYNAYTGRQKQTYDMLSGLSGSGQNAAVNLGGFAGSTAANIGSNIIGAGNASAAGTIGATNAATSGINNATTNYLLYSLMRQNNQTPGFGGVGSNPY